MNLTLIRHSKLTVLAVLTGLALAGCDNQIYDDLDPCQTHYHLKFRYHYHMKKSDAFPSEVKSVAVWAFDEDGNLEWQYTEEGSALSSEDYRVDLSLKPGKYDFVTWCGLSEDMPFIVDKPTPSSIYELGMTLSLAGDTKADENVSNTPFSGLYHDIKRGVEIIADPSTESDNEIGLSLTKDTNYFKILLQNIDGVEMKKEDFSIRITDGNNRLEFDNSVGNGVRFDYIPWNVTSSATTVDDENESEGTLTKVSGLLAELHTSRLMENGKYRLIVHRNSDDKDIINIPLIEYLLLVKGNYRPMGNQEYLDRQDEYSMTFFLDRYHNWYMSIGIYVNAWHVLPPQEEQLQ